MSIGASEPIVTTRGLDFSYNSHPRQPINAPKGIQLDLYQVDYLAVRRAGGMVFQEPNDQIVATVACPRSSWQLS